MGWLVSTCGKERLPSKTFVGMQQVTNKKVIARTESGNISYFDSLPQTVHDRYTECLFSFKSEWRFGSKAPQLCRFGSRIETIFFRIRTTWPVHENKHVFWKESEHVLYCDWHLGLKSKTIRDFDYLHTLSCISARCTAILLAEKEFFVFQIVSLYKRLFRWFENYFFLDSAPRCVFWQHLVQTDFEKMEQNVCDTKLQTVNANK